MIGGDEDAEWEDEEEDYDYEEEEGDKDDESGEFHCEVCHAFVVLYIYVHAHLYYNALHFLNRA
jgi:hypothetical protein